MFPISTSHTRLGENMRPLCFILMCAGSSWVFTANIITQSQLSVTAQLGDSVTLQCFISYSPRNNYIWFKQTFGKAPQYISSSKADSNDSIFYNEFQKSNRFQIQKTKSSFNLLISALEPSDTGTYYCGVVRHSDVLFGNGTELCLSDVPLVKVFQPPVLTPVQYGGSVTVKCIITGVRYRDHHHVYWFWKTKEGTHQSFKTSSENIIQYNSSSEECVYSLQKQNFSSWDVGTYYCALTMCGQIFLGNGAELNPSGQNHTILGVLCGGSALLVVLLILCAVIKMRQRCPCASKVNQNATQTNLYYTSDAGISSQDTRVYYAALRFAQRKK